MKPKEKKIIYILIIALIIIDQIAKILIFKTDITLINNAGWGIGILANQKSENNIAYILISIVAVMMLVRYINSNNTFIKKDSRVILSFAISGAISNSIDRIWNGGTNYMDWNGCNTNKIHK